MNHQTSVSTQKLCQHEDRHGETLQFQKPSSAKSSAAVCFSKPDHELWRALRWAEGVHWFPSVGELDLLRAEYRIALAKAA